MRTVEYFRLWNDRTWDTAFLKVPDSVPNEMLNDYIQDAVLNINWVDFPPVIVGLYCASNETDWEEITSGN